MKSIILSVVNNALGSLIENIASDQFNYSLTQGKVDLKNVQIKPSFFNGFSFPLDLIYGKIASIKVNYSLLSIGSTPIKIEIDGFYAYLQ